VKGWYLSDVGLGGDFLKRGYSFISLATISQFDGLVLTQLLDLATAVDMKLLSLAAETAIFISFPVGAATTSSVLRISTG
jgi:hypothetical protein